jgi:sodium transport system permease protein
MNLDSTGQGGGRIAWNQIKTLYRYELRSAFREKTIVINSILIPIFLYPLIMWIAFSALSFIQGRSEKALSRVALAKFPTDHPGLRARLERDKRIQLVHIDTNALAMSIPKGQLDAFIEFKPPSDAGAALPGNFAAQITFDGSKDRSAKARERVQAAIDSYRRDWLKREARQRGISADDWKGFIVATQNVATEKQMGGFILGMMLPVLFVVMVAAGCFYPAVDCTAGERERNTWETLASSAATRVNIVAAKYLYVTTLGGMAGALNLLAFSLTLKPIFAPLLEAAGTTLNFSVPLVAFPFLVLAAVLLAGFVAAGMMIFASFARTFKEGQAMIMPFYLVVLVPPMFLQTPGIQFTVPLAFIPVVNVTMLVRSVLAGTFPWLQIGITIVVSLLIIALCIRLAAFILNFEDIMIGSYNGSLKQFFRERILRRSKTTMLKLKGGND